MKTHTIENSKYCTSSYMCGVRRGVKSILPQDYKYKWCNVCRNKKKIYSRKYRSRSDVKNRMLIIGTENQPFDEK